MIVALETSGVVNVGEPGSAGFGTIRAGAMEQRSNVDLTAELVDLITARVTSKQTLRLSSNFKLTNSNDY